MALSQMIEVYQGNTKVINVNMSGSGLPGDLSGYTAYLIVKREKTDDDDIKLFQKTGTINGTVANFATDPADNTQDAGDFYFEVYITDGSNVFTVVQDVYRILESVKY